MKEYTPKLAFEIKALIDLGVPKAVIARKYGISRQSLYKWMEKLKKQM